MMLRANLFLVILYLLCLPAQAKNRSSGEILGLDIPIRTKTSAGQVPRRLPKNRLVVFPLKGIPDDSYHIAVEVRSADVTGQNGKSFLGGYNYFLPEILYTISVNGKPVPMQISCRPPLRLKDEKRMKCPVYVGWLLSDTSIHLKSGDRLKIQCDKKGGFVRRIRLLDANAWEAEKIRASDIPHPRSDIGWGPRLFTRLPMKRWYTLRSLADVVKAMELFSQGFVKPYPSDGYYNTLILKGKELCKKIEAYRNADESNQAAICKGAALARQWCDYFSSVETTLQNSIPPIVQKIRFRLEFEKKGIAVNQACFAGREATYCREVALQYLDGAMEELKKFSDPNDYSKQHILNLITFVDNAAEFANQATEWVSKPQKTVEFPDYFVSAPEDKIQAPLSVASDPRGEICLNGVWDFAINTGPDNPPRPDEWPRKQQVPHGEWGYAINKANISVTKWLKQARAYWEWYEDNVWYHAEFDVPANWSGRRMVLAFEEVNAYAEVFVNGKYTGNHRTGLIPFEINVTKYLVPGAKNNILVYVMSASKTARPGSYYRYKTRPNLYATRTEEGYFGGITGDVYLRAMPHARIVDTYVRTWADKRIRVETTVQNGTRKPIDEILNYNIRKGGKDVYVLPPQKVHLNSGEIKTVVTEATWPEAKLWGVGGKYGRPTNLYYLVSKLGHIDITYTEFGFRELKIQGTGFFLNNIPFRLQGDNFSAVKRYIDRRCRWYINQLYRLERQANINFTRAHQHSMCPDHAEIANRIGILLEPEGPWWSLNPPGDIIDQRATTQRSGWYGRMMNRVYEDPVWRDNCREYYQTIVKRYRNDPSVAIFSTENESLDGINADTIYQFNQWIKKVAPHMIVDCHSNASIWDDRFEIANFHDYDIYVSRMQEWAKVSGPNHKPIIIGEFYNYSLPKVIFKSPPKEARAAEWAMSKWIERRFSEYIQKLNANPMYFTYETNSGALWSNSNPETSGPWGDLAESKQFNGVIEMDWPSTSGRGGYKVDRFLSVPETGPINYCDPARVAATPTKVFDAFQKAYQDIPGWSNRRQPELIVKILQGGKPISGINVFLVPRENQATQPLGVKADSGGKAWFVVREPGKYAVQVRYKGINADNSIPLQSTVIENRGGYDYIPRATIDLDYPDKMAVSLPSQPPLRRPAVRKNKNHLSAIPVLPQGTQSVSPEGFIRDWMICGPFPGGGRDVDDKTVGWSVDHLRSTGGALETTPSSGLSYRVKFEETKYAFWESAEINVSWRRYVSPGDYVNLGEAFQRNDVKGLDFSPVQFVVGYAACTINSPVDQDVVFAIGSDDGYKLYLNHKLLKAHRVYRGAKKDEDTISAHLKKGPNLLMLKVEQDIGGYGFYLRCKDHTAKPIKTIEINNTDVTSLGKDGWIRKWLICGPFANPGRGLNERTWAFDYLTSNGGEEKIQPAVGMNYVAEFSEDPTVSWTPGKVRVSWRSAESAQEGFVNLSREFVTKKIQGLDFPPVENVLGYAAVYIYCDKPIRARFEIETNNGVKVWLNHKQIFDKHVHRYNTDPASPNKTIFEKGNYYRNVTLNKGMNTLLLKLDVAGGPFQFRFRFVDEQGKPVPNLRVSTEPRIYAGVFERDFIFTRFQNPSREGYGFYRPDAVRKIVLPARKRRTVDARPNEL